MATFVQSGEQRRPAAARCFQYVNGGPTVCVIWRETEMRRRDWDVRAPRWVPTTAGVQPIRLEERLEETASFRPRRRRRRLHRSTVISIIHCHDGVSLHAIWQSSRLWAQQRRVKLWDFSSFSRNQRHKFPCASRLSLHNSVPSWSS